MSLFANDIIKKANKETRETLTSQLLTPDNYETKTRIKNVVGMSVYDLITMHYSDDSTKRKFLEIRDQSQPIKVGEYLFYLGKKIQIHAISENGQSRREFVESTVGISSSAQQEQKLITSFFN